MSPHTFATSPGATGEQRKFINPTRGYVGANVFGPDGKPTSIAVEPGGEVWLTPEEERMTAEAPRLAQDNPFVKEWDEEIAWDPATGLATSTVTRRGILVVSDEPPRPVASDREIPARGSADDLRQTREAMEGLSTSDEELKTRAAVLEAREAALAAREAALAEKEAEETVKGADVDTEAQPPVQGQPSENEIVGTPEAPGANEEALAAREPTAEQPTRKRGGIAT